MGDFWSQHAASSALSPFEEKLKNPETTLNDILDDEATSHHLNMQTQMLIDFLSRPDNLDKIQDFISKARNPINENYKVCMKFPYVATQLISEYRIEKIMEQFLEVGTQKEGRRLRNLFTVYRDVEIDGLNPTLTGYVDEALVSFLKSFPRVTLKTCLERENMKLLIDNSDDFAAILVLIKLVFIDRNTQEILAKEGNTFLSQRKALLDEILGLFLKSAEPSSSSSLEALGDLNRQKIINYGTLLRYLPKNVLGVELDIVQVYKDSSFIAKILSPLFESGLRETIAAESLSVVNLLIEEVFARKKRSAGGDQFQDQEDERDSDDFLFSQPFLDLFSKVARRSSEILSKTAISNSNLAYQLTSFISNCVNFKNNQLDQTLLESDALSALYCFIEKTKRNNLVHSKVIATFNTVFGPEPRDSLGAKSIGSVVSLIANSLGSGIKNPPNKKDIATQHLLSLQLIIARSLLVAATKSAAIKSAAEQSSSWAAFSAFSSERVRQYDSRLADYRAEDFTTKTGSSGWGMTATKDPFDF